MKSRSFGYWYVDEKGVLKKKSKYSSPLDGVQYYVGTYERALEFFAVDQSDAGYSRKKSLIDVVIYHQLDQRALTKLSTELYDVLYEAAKNPYYWVPEEERQKAVLEVLLEAKEKSLLHDSEILRDCKYSKSKSQRDRVARYVARVRELEHSAEEETASLLKELFEDVSFEDLEEGGV